MAHVTVIIPTYNRAHCIGVAIESVLGQSFTDLELLIVDDGSTDGTTQVVEQYLPNSGSQGPKVRFLQLSHKGKSAALNAALRSVESEWVAFLDSDDEWLPEKLERQFEALKRFPDVQVCFTDFLCINNPKMDTTIFRFYGRSFDGCFGRVSNTVDAILDTPFVSVVTLVCRTELVRQVGAFDPSLRFTEDYDFVFRLALSREFCYVNEPLVRVDRSIPTVRHTGTSAIWDDIDFRLNCERYRFNKWLGMGDMLSPSTRRKIRVKLRGVHSSFANQHLRRREYDRALESIGKAFDYQITPALVAKWLLTICLPSAARTLTLGRRGFKTEQF